MRIWIVATGEPWPTDEGRPRLLRGGILAKHCAARGDAVTWWNTTFDHRKREDRFGKAVVRNDSSGVTIRGLYAPTPYSRSVSLSRIVNHVEVGRAFRREVEQLEKPDVILACMPLVELAYEAVRYGRKHGIPVVVDLRDFWPDVWLEPIPSVIHPLARVPLAPWTWMLRQALQGCDGISGITDSFLQWGLAKAGRSRRASDFVAPLAYDTVRARADEIEAADKFWDDLGVPRGPTFVASYFGTLANRIGAELIVEAARIIPAERRRDIRLVIAGEGEACRALKQRAEGLEHVLFPGWVDLPKIAALKARSSVGLIAYPNTPDFRASIPNKVLEYLAGDLPVVSTLEGEVHALLKREHAGVHVAERTAEALAATLIALADDPVRLIDLQNGARAAKKSFESAILYERFRGNLERLIPGHRQAETVASPSA